METSESKLKHLEVRLKEAENLLNQLSIKFKNVEGLSKLEKRLHREIEISKQVKTKAVDQIAKFIKTTNISYFSGFICVAQQYNCCAFFKTFQLFDNSVRKLEVDIIAENGTKWIKVITRSSRSLALESVGAADRTLHHAEQYLTFASNFLIFFQPPSVIMEFVNKVPDVLAKKLTSLGVEVKGVEASLSDFINLPSVDSDDDFYQEILIPEPIRQKPVVIDTVNFDVSAVFVLISSMTEENGTNYRFRSSLLEMQAEEERKLPARPMLIEAMKDKRLIICRSAYNAVREIIKTVAGASEKKRAEIFLDKIEIVEDKLSQRIERLQTGLKITKRTKVIFGSGDFYKAVTATSNKHFVNAASQQGVSLAVILVQSRALSEQKQMELLER